jgi:hypothetical protein
MTHRPHATAEQATIRADAEQRIRDLQDAREALLSEIVAIESQIRSAREALEQLGPASGPGLSPEAETMRQQFDSMRRGVG